MPNRRCRGRCGGGDLRNTPFHLARNPARSRSRKCAISRCSDALSAGLRALEPDRGIRHHAARPALDEPTDGAPSFLIRYTRPASPASEMRLRPSFLRTTPARNPRTECGCQPVAPAIAAIVAPGRCPQHGNHAGLFAVGPQLANRLRRIHRRLRFWFARWDLAHRPSRSNIALPGLALFGSRGGAAL